MSWLGFLPGHFVLKERPPAVIALVGRAIKKYGIPIIPASCDRH